MITANQIKPDIPVVCSLDGQFAVVDHMEGQSTIKLKKDENGQHHYIPLSWVTSAEDDEVKVDLPGDQAMQQWSTTAVVSTTAVI
jgi:hypothetical protein